MLYETDNPQDHDILNVFDSLLYQMVYENEEIVKYRKALSRMMVFELDAQNHNFRVNFKSREMNPILFDVSYRITSS